MVTYHFIAGGRLYISIWTRGVIFKDARYFQNNILNTLDVFMEAKDDFLIFRRPLIPKNKMYMDQQNETNCQYTTTEATPTVSMIKFLWYWSTLEGLFGYLSLHEQITFTKGK